MNLHLLKICLPFICLILITSCSSSPLKGKWQYDGGVYDGRAQKASSEFQMQRNYADDTYEAFMLEGNTPPELYNSGIYKVKNDSLMITSQYSSRPSQNTDVMITYKFNIEKEKLTITGILPNGMIVEEYWIKLK